VAQVDLPLQAAVARAHRETAAWLAGHPLRDDAAFAGWAQRAMGPPPDGTRQRAELAALHRLAPARDSAGVTAATWLEHHGEKQVRKLYGHQYRDFAPKALSKRQKHTHKAALALAATLQASAKERFARPSPYVTDPSVNALNQAKFMGQKRLSYPSMHAVLGVAAVAVLRHYEPAREPEYRWMADRDRLLAPLRRRPLPLRPHRRRIPRHGHRRLRAATFSCLTTSRTERHATDELECPRRPAPVLPQKLLPSRTQHRAEDGGDEDGVIELARDRDEVGNEV
jgi:hypothetical protein